jgi:hypothetical protein
MARTRRTSPIGKSTFLDFCYKRDVLFRMVGDARHLVVLDHHKTAEADLAGFEDDCTENDVPFPTIVFDMEKSGARLAWEHFYPSKPAPWLVGYVEDRDLWRWALPYSKEISAYLATRPRTFAEWDDLNDIPGPGYRGSDTRVDQGSAILQYQAQLVEAICKTAREVTLAGIKILTATTSCLFSEVAGGSAPIVLSAAWFNRSDGRSSGRSGLATDSTFRPWPGTTGADTRRRLGSRKIPR